MKSSLYIIISVLFLISCKKDEISTCNDSEPLYLHSDFPIGVAINMNELQYNHTYENIVVDQFNSVTADNIFKAYYLHPAPNDFYWTEADKLADFCAKNNKRLHGHTLVWHNQLPEWIENYDGSKSDWENLFKTHIQTIVTHFKGKVTSWDVVNEAFNDDGTLRNSVWKKNIGASYIEKAFRYAHEADPQALLFYNDYDIALNENKREAILNLLESLKGRGVPIHGVGMQMHVSILHPENVQIEDALLEISHKGYKIHLSEIDISINPLGKDVESSEILLLRQADKLKAITTLYKNIPAHLRYGMTMWGVSDADTWITGYFNRVDFPLLYDKDFNPKPVYCHFKDAL